jgi:hypothetical protein
MDLTVINFVKQFLSHLNLFLMKYLFSLLLLCVAGVTGNTLFAQGSTRGLKKQLFIDVHHLGAGNVSYEAVAQAHAKDLATEGKYRVKFLRYWVDTAKGDVYCLSSAYDTASITRTHAEAHGLLPAAIYPVKAGADADALIKTHKDAHGLIPKYVEEVTQGTNH